MRGFAGFLRELEGAQAVAERKNILSRYFRGLDENDATAAATLLLGRTPDAILTSSQCRAMIQEIGAWPEWLVDASLAATDDMAEMAARILPEPEHPSPLCLSAVLDTLDSLGKMSLRERMESVADVWQELDAEARVVLNRLLLGETLLTVESSAIAEAVSALYGGHRHLLEHLLASSWDPRTLSLHALAASTLAREDYSRPLDHHPLILFDGDVTELGDVRRWSVAWYAEGIRAQLVRRAGASFLWGEGCVLLSHEHPEILQASMILEGSFVLEGIVTAYRNGALSSPRVAGARSTAPMVFMAYDVIERDGKDRPAPFEERQELLESILSSADVRDVIVPATLLSVASWEDLLFRRANARRACASGLLLRERAESIGKWLVWKPEPIAVLTGAVYAERSQTPGDPSIRLTLGAVEDRRLLPVGAVDVICDAHLAVVAAFMEENTVERFGPVCALRPGLAVRVECDSVVASRRRKSGVALVNPCIVEILPGYAGSIDLVHSLKLSLA